MGPAAKLAWLTDVELDAEALTGAALAADADPSPSAALIATTAMTFLSGVNFFTSCDISFLRTDDVRGWYRPGRVDEQKWFQ